MSSHEHSRADYCLLDARLSTIVSNMPRAQLSLLLQDFMINAAAQDEVPAQCTHRAMSMPHLF